MEPTSHTAHSCQPSPQPVLPLMPWPVDEPVYDHPSAEVRPPPSTKLTLVIVFLERLYLYKQAYRKGPRP